MHSRLAHNLNVEITLRKELRRLVTCVLEVDLYGKCG